MTAMLLASGVVLAGAFGLASASADPALVGEWHLDAVGAGATTPDASGNNLTGTGVAATPTPGRFGSGLQFTNTGDGVDVPDSALLRPNRMTVMAWVKATQTPLQYRTLVGKGADLCSDRSYVLDVGSEPGRLRFAVRLFKPDGDSYLAAYVQAESSAPGIWDGRWHAVAGSYDGAVARLWVDGVQVSSAAVPAGFTDVLYPGTGDPRLSFGRYVEPGGGCDQSGFQYLGALDEVRIYNRALTPTEIGYLQTSAGPAPPELPPPTVSMHPAAHFTISTSLKLPGATRFSAVNSIAPLGRKIVDYNWQINSKVYTALPDQTVDMDCGHSPVMAHIFLGSGRYNVILTVTDSSGEKSSTNFPVPGIPAPGKLKVLTLPEARTFDCENPAQGNQASRADCVKTIAFGILEVNGRGRADECFSLQPTGVHGVGIYRYVDFRAKINGPVAINGLYVPIPHSVGTEYDSAAHTIALAGVSSIPVRVGPFLTKTISLNLTVDPDRFGNFHVVDVDKAINTPSFLGSLPVRGALSISLSYHQSSVKVGIGLPSPLSFGGGRAAQADAYLISDNVNGLHLDGLSAQVPSLWLGPIYVSSLSLKYIKSQDLWQGGAKITLPGSTLSIDAAGPPTQPPDFGFGIKNGHFDHAGFAADFNFPAQPDLFPPFHAVLLSHIGAAIGIDPLRLTGTIGITASDVVDENGVLYAAFANSDNPYQLPGDIGPELAPLAGRTLDSFTLAIGGTASLKVPILGSVPLLNAYGLYEYPDYFEFGGGFSFGVSFLQLDGGVSGFVYPSNSTFNIEAGVRACLRGIEVGYKFVSVKVSPCIGVGGVISSNGIGFCGVVPIPFPIFGTLDIPVGAGYHWGDDSPDLMLFSCDYSAYRQVSPLAAGDRQGGPGTARAVAGTYSVRLPSGLPAAMFRVTGVGGAPQVTVTDPNGHNVSAGSDAVFVGGTRPGDTLVAVRHPAAGRWTVAAKPGSVPIRSVQSSNALAPLGLKASVTGRGSQRVLRYRVGSIAGRSITFLERGSHTSRVLGVARGTAGRITFTPAPAVDRLDRRAIVAVVSQSGVPSHDVNVATYNPPKLAPLRRPAKLRVSRHHGSIAVSWRRVAGAQRYEVLVTLADGSRLFRVTQRTRITAADPFPRERGSVLVDAVGVGNVRSASSTVQLPR